MANFCGKCGTPLNQETGLCPNCNKASFVQAPVSFIPQQVNTSETAKLQDEFVKPEITEEKFISAVEETAQEVFQPEPKEIPVMPRVTEETVVQPPQQAQPQYIQYAPGYRQAQPQYSQPVYQQPAPVQTAQKAQKPGKPKKDKKPRKQMNKVLSCVLIVFLCILTFATTLYASLAFTLRSATTEDNVYDIVSGADVVELLEELPVSESAKKTSDADNFAELICEYIQYNFYRESNSDYYISVTTRNLETFFEESDSAEFFSELITDYLNDFYNDTGKFSLTAKDVEEFLKDNEDAIEEAFDVSSYDLYRTDKNFTSDIHTYVEVDALKDFSQWLMNDDDIKAIEPAEIKDEMPLAFGAVHYGLSYVAIVIAAVLALGFIVLMFLCNPHQTLYGLGITLLLLGGVLTTFGLIAADIIVPEFTSLNVASYVAGEVISCGLPVFLAILGAGILLLAGGIVVTILKKGKKAE